MHRADLRARSDNADYFAYIGAQREPQPHSCAIG